MALRLSPLPSLCYSSCFLSITVMATPVTPIYRLQNGFNSISPKSFSRVHLLMPLTLTRRGGRSIAKAAADIDEVGGDDGGGAASNSEEEVPSINQLPPEAKLQLKLEQKMKMKIAKKIRLRRKRLVRKRRMRKKGRWPPSKMKKNKNV